LLHAYSRTTAVPSCASAARAQTKTSYSLFNKLAKQYFGYKLRTVNKLRTVEAENPSEINLNSEFTDSYKKSVEFF